MTEPGLDFSERLSRKVLASLKSLNESLGEVRASVAKIDSIAHARLASPKTDRTPTGAATQSSGSWEPENVGAVLATLSFGTSSGAAAVPPPLPVPAPVPPSPAPGPADLSLLKRVLLAPALKGAGLDQDLLADIKGVLQADEVAEVEEHVAMRLPHGPMSGSKSARPHTPPPSDWHPPGSASGRTSGRVSFHAGSPRDEAQTEDGDDAEEGTDDGIEVVAEEDAGLASVAVPGEPVASPGKPGSRPIMLKLKVPPKKQEQDSASPVPQRWFTFPRYKSSPLGEAPADDGADAIPFETEPLSEGQFQALLAEAGTPREVPDEDDGTGVVPGESTVPPPGPLGPWTVADANPVPTVHDWQGGDVDWPTASQDEASLANGRRPKRFEAFALRVVYESGRTGFEEAKDFTAQPGDVVAGRYRVNAFLGSAAFSSALSCTDEVTGLDVALKVIKNNKDFVDQSLDEIKLLRYLNAQGEPDAHGVLRLVDFFYHKEHLFLVTELLKDNLYDWQTYVADKELEPYFTLPRVQRIARQALRALAFIHGCGLIHCDLKPENILVQSYSRCDVKVIDFGSSCFITDRLSSYIQSRSYRAPEVVLGLPYGPKIDVWSLGCILTELLTGKVLFPNESVQTMLVRMQSILGSLPGHMVTNGSDSAKYLMPDGTVYEAAEDAEAGTINLMRPVPSNLAIRSGSDDPLWLDFIASLLSVDPARRPTAAQALAHPWLAAENELAFEPYVMPM